MAEEGTQRHHRQRAVLQPPGPAVQAHQQDRHQSLHRVQQQRHHGRRLAARAQHVGGAGVLAAEGARVGQAHGAADDHGEGERAHQVGGERGERGIQDVHRAPILPAPRFRSLLQRAAHGLGPEQLHAHLRIDAHQVAAPPAIDGDARQRQDGLFDIDRHLPPGAERRGAAHQVAAVAVGDFRRAGLDRLGADLARQVLGRDLAVAVHQHDQRPRLLVLHHQRLDHRERIEPQHLRAVGGAAVLQVLVGVFGERNAVGLEQGRGRRFADAVLPGHGRSDRGVAHLPADAVDLGQQFGRQLRAPGIQVLVELRQRGDADDRAGDLPLAVAEGQRHARGRQAVPARQRVVAARRLQCFRPPPAALAHRVELRDTCRRGRRRAGEAAVVVLARQQTEPQRRIGQQRHAEPMQALVQCVLDAAVDQAVRVLHGGDARQAVLRGQPHEFVHAVRGLVGQPDVPHLALAHQPAQRLELLVDRGLRALLRRVVVHRPERRHVALGPVDLVEVDHVGAQAPERAFARGQDVGPGQALAFADPGHAARGAGDLGGQHDALAQTRVGGQPVADDGFGGAERFLARRHRVHLGRVDEVDAALDRAREDGVGVTFGDLLAEGHGAEADGGDAQVAGAQGDEVHGAEIRQIGKGAQDSAVRGFPLRAGYRVSVVRGLPPARACRPGGCAPAPPPAAAAPAAAPCRWWSWAGRR